MSPGLNASEVEAATRTIAKARGLPGRTYTSSEWARLERDELLGRCWTCIGFADEVPPNHAVPIDLQGTPLLLTRDPEGLIRVFHNVCRHRGHRLVDQPKRLHSGLVCPYHCWTYGFDGKLKRTPHIGGTGIHEIDGFDKSEHGLKEVRSALWLGMVFVNLSADAVPWGEWVAPLMRRWEAFTGPHALEQLIPWVPESDATLEVGANWKLAVENYLESYHLPFVHPELNSYSKIEDHYNIMAEDWGAGQGSTAFNYAARGGPSFPSFPGWPPDKHQHAEYIALYPNVLLGLQRDHLFAMVLTPVTHRLTRESVRLLFVGDEALGDAWSDARETLLKDWMSIFAEDISVVEGMQLGRDSPAFDGGVFSPLHDQPTHHFHGWVARRLAV